MSTSASRTFRRACATSTANERAEDSAERCESAAASSSASRIELKTRAIEMHYDLGFFDHETGRVECADNPFQAKVLLMPSE